MEQVGNPWPHQFPFYPNANITMTMARYPLATYTGNSDASSAIYNLPGQFQLTVDSDHFS